MNVHDFVDKELGKAVPYGVYDVAADAGFFSVGITRDTAAFAVEAILGWLGRMGRERYPKARELTITADCGGSNGARVRLWKVELQKLADETELVQHVHCESASAVEPAGTKNNNGLARRSAREAVRRSTGIPDRSGASSGGALARPPASISIAAGLLTVPA